MSQLLRFPFPQDVVPNYSLLSSLILEIKENIKSVDYIFAGILLYELPPIHSIVVLLTSTIYYLPS